MEYSYSFLILLLPFLSFLVLGLCGMKMKEKVWFKPECEGALRQALDRAKELHSKNGSEEGNI